MNLINKSNVSPLLSPSNAHNTFRGGHSLGLCEEKKTMISQSD
jgi:hypothetical protein